MSNEMKWLVKTGNCRGDNDLRQSVNKLPWEHKYTSWIHVVSHEYSQPLVLHKMPRHGDMCRVLVAPVPTRHRRHVTLIIKPCLLLCDMSTIYFTIQLH